MVEQTTSFLRRPLEALESKFDVLQLVLDVDRVFFVAEILEVRPVDVNVVKACPVLPNIYQEQLQYTNKMAVTC